VSPSALYVSFPFIFPFPLSSPLYHYELKLTPLQDTCLASAILEVGCQLNDPACQCGPSQLAIETAVVQCLLGACSSSDLAAAISAGEAACSAFSVTRTLVPKVATSTSTEAQPVVVVSTKSVMVTSASVAVVGSESASALGPVTTEKATMTPSQGVVSITSAVSMTQSSGKAFVTANAAMGMGIAGVGIGGLFGVLAGVVAVL